LIDVLRRETIDRALIFTRTKHRADMVARGLSRAGVGAEAIHGNKSQNQRERVLAAFRKGEVRILVATDIAARGIDVDGVSHVVNFDLPNVPETYVHRIGRTARAGAEGVAISLCDGEEVTFLRDIEKLIRMTIPVNDRHADQRRSAPRTTGSPIKSTGNTKRRRGGRSGLARKKSRHSQPNHDQANEVPRGIGAVAFIRGKDTPKRDHAPRAQRWAGPSQGT
jgi:superfamily II DNA/RNA helicase